MINTKVTRSVAFDELLGIDVGGGHISIGNPMTIGSIPPVGETQQRWVYTSMYIPTGDRWVRETTGELTHWQFLALINGWNAQDAGRWQYWY